MQHLSYCKWFLLKTAKGALKKTLKKSPSPLSWPDLTAVPNRPQKDGGLGPCGGFGACSFPGHTAASEAVVGTACACPGKPLGREKAADLSSEATGGKTGCSIHSVTASVTSLACQFVPSCSGIKANPRSCSIPAEPFCDPQHPSSPVPRPAVPNFPISIL